VHNQRFFAFTLMTSSPLPDVSLYELAVNANPALQPLQLSPTTFKSVVGLFLNFLIENSLPATIWLKLPRDEVWQAEVDRFCQLAPAPYNIYSLQTYQKPVVKSSQPSGQAKDSGQVKDQVKDKGMTTASAAPSPTLATQKAASSQPENTQVQSSATELQNELDELWLDESDLPNTVIDSPDISPRVQMLPLAAESQLKREYFLLVVSPAFQGMVVAHRPRSVRGQEAAKLQGEDLDRKHPLLGVCVFDQATLQQVLEAGINAAICFGQADTTSSASLQSLLISWNDLEQQHQVSRLDPALMGSLLVKQIQQQETLWRSSAAQRRQAEALPEMQQENQVLLNTLRLKDEFIKTIGLELRTPLSTMKTALSLLNSSNIKPPQRQRYMEMLSQECDRQGSLIAGVLDLVQIESSSEQVPIEALHLSDIVPGVVSTYQPLSQEKGVMLAYVVPEDLPPVACPTSWLKQIVINLLHNSIKFTPAGGQVWVRARQQGELLQLEFRDSGVGIASSDLPRIFDRFYRVRGASEDGNGVGLGLSIVQQLLLRCGGSIAVKSKQGEGSIFTVNLPIYEQ
jgi:two-component system, OmpR family, phosphate regulon sensor histidine kinase PhoR